MRYMKWIGLLAAATLIYACFSVWVVIESRGIMISGVDSTGTNFGKPGYFNLLMTAFFLFFHLVPRVWAKRANLLVTVLNLGWAVRNYFIISQCEAGDCPIKKAGLFLLVISSLIMLIAALFPDMSLPGEKAKSSV